MATIWTCTDLQMCTSTTNGETVGLSALITAAGPRHWPEVTMIALGSNMLGDPLTFNATMNSITKLIKQVISVGSKCIWIGPPVATTKNFSTTDYTALVALMKETVQNNGCYFIDSSNKTDLSGLDPDGLHYKGPPANAWAQKVFAEVQTILNL